MTQIFVSKSQHRFDSQAKPAISFADWTGNTKLFIRDYLYLQVEKANYVWSPPNRTDYPLSVCARETINAVWTVSAGITNAALTFSKSGADGFSGATAQPIVAGDCSVEGTPGNINASTVLALQSGAPSFDYVTTDAVEHALVFDQGGSGVIREKGIVKARFGWIAGETGLVEKKGDIVRYYKITSSGDMILLRSKRSLLSYPVTPTIIIYHAGGTLNNVRVWNGTEVSVSLDLFGVLNEFQDLRNAGSLESLAEKTTNKDKTDEFTYFSAVKNLLGVSVSVAWDEGENYRKFFEFYKWHDQSREFIFVDAARNKEYFARFTSGFGDAPLGADIFGMSAEIRQILDPPMVL